MTISYNAEVATLKGFGVFWKLLLRWRGSIYKLIWREMLVYIAIYYIIRSINVVMLSAEQKVKFAEIVLYCRSYSTLIPISFVLGFYVNVVMTRWWSQYEAIPWPDNLAVLVTNLIHGQDDRGRLMRRTVMRYVNLSYVLTTSMISPRVKKRFPTLDHLVEAGFMTPKEKKIYGNFMDSFPHSLYWMPLVWAGSIVMRARKEGRIRDDFACKTLLDTINIFRSGLGTLLGYDTMSIPIVYTQVVTLAVYSYFASTLMGAQFVKESQASSIDLFVPWFTILQYLFYVGWLKVAETLINPFGEDDDDFELNGLIDRNFQLGYLIVDEMNNEHPDLVEDKYWDEIMPAALPYTVATEAYRRGPVMGSTANIPMNKQQQLFVRRDDDGSQRSTPSVCRRKNNLVKPDADITKLSMIDEESVSRNADLWTSEEYAASQNKSVLGKITNFNWRRSSIKSQQHVPDLASVASGVNADQFLTTPSPKLKLNKRDSKKYYDNHAIKINIDME